jgi:hypothetical protein
VSAADPGPPLAHGEARLGWSAVLTRGWIIRAGLVSHRAHSVVARVGDQEVRLDQLVPAAAFSVCSTISPSIVIWISSLTTSLPSSTMLRLTPKSFRLILVVAP